MKSIVFTGGGSAGHVTPNIALIEMLVQQNWRISYVGSYHGIEKQLITKLNIAYYPIHTGKLRRYFSWQNFLTPVYILLGIAQAFFIIRKLTPKTVFSKGGFVAFPVVFAAWLNRIPVIVHESDLTPGLANRLSFPFANNIALTFSASQPYFKNSNKVTVTGNPIRLQLLKGNKDQGLRFCQFKATTPCILVIGGSLGAHKINQTIRQALPLLNNYQIIHICGMDKTDSRFNRYSNYYQLEYVEEELADILAASDYIISRAGANSLYEILCLKKPHVLIPLAHGASRGDQVENADYFKKLGVSQVVDEASLTVETLIKQLNYLVNHQAVIECKLKALNTLPGNQAIIKLINHLAENN